MGFTGTTAQVQSAISAGTIKNGMKVTITDDYQEASSSLRIYSTDEIEIGRWIDNKPVYRKVIKINGFVSGSNQTLTHNLNIDRYILATFTGIHQYPNYYGAGSVQNGYLVNLFNLNTNAIQYNIGASYGFSSSTPLYFIFEYTKNS